MWPRAWVGVGQGRAGQGRDGGSLYILLDQTLFGCGGVKGIRGERVLRVTVAPPVDLYF